MATTIKMTKKEMFADLRAALKSYDLLTAARAEFIDHEVELLNKKSGSERKPTAVQVANEGYKDAICAGMEPDRAYTVSEINKEIPEVAMLSFAKVNALVAQLRKEGRVEKTEVKGKALFTVAE